MMGAYVTHSIQVAALLGYGEPQILKVLKINSSQNFIGYCFQLMIIGKQLR